MSIGPFAGRAQGAQAVAPSLLPPIPAEGTDIGMSPEARRGEARRRGWDGRRELRAGAIQQARKLKCRPSVSSALGVSAPRRAAGETRARTKEPTHPPRPTSDQPSCSMRTVQGMPRFASASQQSRAAAALATSPKLTLPAAQNASGRSPSLRVRSDDGAGGTAEDERARRQN